MNDLKIFWFHPQTPAGYHNHVMKFSSGIADEYIVSDFLKTYLPSKDKIVVDLGIGTGRELIWLDKVLRIEKIIGIDYSPVMIKFLKKQLQNYKHKVELIIDDLFKPSLLSKKVQKEKASIIYLSLMNTFGNFSEVERIKVLKNIRFLLKSKDRIILALYKRLQNTKLINLVKDSPRLQTKNPIDQHIMIELIEYGLLQFFWTSVMDKYNQPPRFWYDKKNNDIAIHLDGRRLLTSHRFSQEEIQNEFKKSGLKIDKIIEGKAMWIVVGRS